MMSQGSLRGGSANDCAISVIGRDITKIIASDTLARLLTQLAVARL
jgi:hypothetical protein